jgi:hypothetical protein
MFLSFSVFRSKNSFTLIEVLIGTFLILIVFLGIFGAFQLGLRVVGLSKVKIIATSIANAEIEKIRNLPYQSIGVRGSFPDGVLESSTTTVENNIEFKIERRVDYIVDSTDGIAAPEDECPNDYKRAEIKVSWSGLFRGEVIFSTDIAPKNLAEECATGGGVLSVLVFDAYGATTSSPLIEIKNPTTGETIKTATPPEGKHYFSLATSTYKVVVSKDGYSSEQTFGSGDIYQGKTIATPEKPNPIVLEGQLTEISFSIDRLSSFSINTLSPWGTDNFSDSFSDQSKVSSSSEVIISGGKVDLATSSEGYLPSGYLISIAISPTTLIKWDQFSWTDSEPIQTDLKYQIYYASGTDWLLIPDSDLSGNSIGFDNSPVDLSNLSTTTYSQLKIRANFSTNSTTTTPTLYDWQISWIISEALPVSNATFSLRGAKIVGTNGGENPIYKYSISTSTDSNGKKDLPNLEWDNYTFSIDPTTGLDLVSTDPSPQPISLAPNTNLTVKLYLDAENSLLLTVENQKTLEPVFSATIRLYNLSLGYDKTQYTNEKGQTLFIPLESANYNLEISAPGYSSTSTTASVSGDVTKIIRLEQIE